MESGMQEASARERGVGGIYREVEVKSDLWGVAGVQEGLTGSGSPRGPWGSLGGGGDQELVLAPQPYPGKLTSLPPPSSPILNCSAPGRCKC